MTRNPFIRAVPALALLVLILLSFHFSAVSENVSSTPFPSTSQEKLQFDLAQGRPMQALYQIEALSAQTGWTHELQRQTGDLWREVGDLARAVPYWQAASNALPDDTELVRQLAEAYITLQRWPDAADALDRLLALTPDDTWARYQLGLIRAPFDPHTAATQLQLVAESPVFGDQARTVLVVVLDNPDDVLISMRVGVAFADLELWPYAELAFRHAADIGQPFPEALAYVGLARDLQGKDGSTWIEQALALAPQNPQVLYLDGLHLRAEESYQHSLDRLIQAASLEPENPAFLAELGTAYRLLNDLPSAEYWLKTAAAISGGEPRFQELLAKFYADEAYNLASGGLAALEQTARLFPDNPDVRASYGWALYITGEREAALSNLDAALAVAPTHSRSLYYKAQILLEDGNRAEAESLFAQVAASDSEFAVEAGRVLEQLEG